MKLSVPQWLSVAIVLPLITVILNPITPAFANNSNRISAISSEKIQSELVNSNLVARITNPESNKIKFKKYKSKSKSRKKIRVGHFKFSLSSSSGRTYLRLIPSSYRRMNKVGNPIYRLEAYVNGQPYRTFKAVTGTAYTQNKNRHRANSAAPLPDGYYQVSRKIVRGSMAEVGRTFVPIYPRFKTSRHDLGVHLDPSYNKRNGHDGTAGCIGLTSGRDRDAFNRYVKKFQPRTLIVRIR